MVRKLLVAALALASVLTAVLGGGWWLLGSEAGQRLLLAEAARRGSLTLDAGRTEGSLWTGLRLEEVRVGWPGGEFRCAALTLNWHPAALLYGRMAIDELAIAGGELHWSATAPATPAEGLPAWPRLEGWPLRLSAAIDTLAVDGFTLHPPQGEPLRLDRLRAIVRWHGGELALSGLDAAAAGGRLRGEATAGLHRPALRLDLALELPAGGGLIRRLALKTAFAAAGESELAGPLSLTAERESGRQLQFSGSLALRRDGLFADQLEISEEGRSGSLHGSLQLRRTGGIPAWAAHLEPRALDLAPELGRATVLDGSIDAAGDSQHYRGTFSLANAGAGAAAIRLGGSFAGDGRGLALDRLAGAWLGGTLNGRLTVGWADGVTVAASLAGRQLDPAQLTPQWHGTVNLDLAGDYRRSAAGLQQGTLHLSLPASTLRGIPLTGRLDARLSGDDLQFDNAELNGDGFRLGASGSLATRLTVRGAVSRLGALVPEAGGSVSGEGWLRRQGTVLSGAVEARGVGLTWRELGAAAVQLHGSLAGEPAAGSLRLAIDGLRAPGMTVDRLALAAQGRLDRHTVTLDGHWAEGALQAAANGGWQEGEWQGTLERLDGRDGRAAPWTLAAPAAIAAAAEHFAVAPLRLTTASGESLELSAGSRNGGENGEARLAWQGLALARLERWFPGTALDGTGSGSLRASWREGGQRAELAGDVTAAGGFRHERVRVAVPRAGVNFTWGPAGLRAEAAVELSPGGKVHVELDSPQPGSLALPTRGRLQSAWTEFDLALLSPWLGDRLTCGGTLNGTAGGNWAADGALALEGDLAIRDGWANYFGDDGELLARLQTARAAWSWRERTLQGEIELELADYGSANGSFRLPLPARLPAALDPDGPLHLELTAKGHELGVLSAFFPGLIANSRGDFAVAASAGGTWRRPRLAGRLQLSGAGASLLDAGIELKELGLQAELADSRVQITSFTARSGDGRLQGQADLRLQDWQVGSFSGELSGERFTAVDLPELQVQVSPQLTFSGHPGTLQVRGGIAVPALVLSGYDRRQVLGESPDVRVAGRDAAPPAFPFALDARLKVTLGERVLIRQAGIDARLAGALELAVKGPGTITATGQIRSVEGSYSTYGTRLDIRRGRLLYSGGPLDQPTLDILALRTVGDVEAGVAVAGTLQKPAVRLYSDPAMPDTDILAYIALGQPLGAGTEQVNALNAAAGALLSRGQSVILKDQLKRQLGLDVIGIEGSDPVSGPMLTVGKYLSPRLYLSIGQSLFTNVSEARLRYTLGRRWELESKFSSQASGVDLYYRVY